jgi:hypothetical protein
MRILFSSVCTCPNQRFATIMTTGQVLFFKSCIFWNSKGCIYVVVGNHPYVMTDLVEHLSQYISRYYVACIVYTGYFLLLLPFLTGVHCFTQSPGDFVEKGDPDDYDSGVRYKWHWDWLDMRLPDQPPFSHCFRKLKLPGTAYCICCDRNIYYKHRGISVLKEHVICKRHKQQCNRMRGAISNFL